MSKINKVLYNVDQRDSTKGEPTTADERRIARKNLGLDEVVGQNATSQESGIAPLDANGKVPAVHLPSYVDDIVDGYYYDGSFYEEAGHTTVILGETGKIYVDITSGGDNTSYRYDGTHFVQISAQNTYSKVAFKGSGASSATTIASTQVSDTFQFTSGEGINLSQVGSSKELKIDVDFGSGNSGKSVTVSSSGTATVSDLTYSSSTASGNTLAFIDSVSQSANGQISATKKNVTVDTVFDATGTNPVNGIAVSKALETLGVNDISGLSDALAAKQDTLTAGNNVRIDNNVISATDTTYTAGSGLALNGTVFSNAAPNVKSDWNAAVGSDAEILNKPTIPTVNDGTLTIKMNNTAVATFSANQSSAATANITVPTDTSDLTNGAGFISSTGVGNHKYLTTNGSGVATWVDKPIRLAYYDDGDLENEYADAIEIFDVENSPNRKIRLLVDGSTSDKGYLVPTPIANKVLTTNSNGDISWQNATRIQVQYTQTPSDVGNLLFNPSIFSINADNTALGFYVPSIPSGLTEPLLGSFNNRPSWVDGSPIVAGDYVTINEIADNKVELGVNTSLEDGLATSARLNSINSALSYQISGVAREAETNLWKETVTACDAVLDYYDPEEAHPDEDIPYEKKLGPMEWIKLCEIEYTPDDPYYTEIVAHFNVLGKFSSWHNANSAVFIAEVYAGITVQTESTDRWIVNCGGKVVHNTAQTYANDMSIELYQSEENPNLVGVLLHCPNAENSYSRVHVEGNVHVVKGEAANVEINREVGIDTGLDWPAWNYYDPRSGHGRTLLKKVYLST